ncbi:hypothetical protein [Nostoc sp. LPT]|uniref:hypothetical protein n=1 Tax=Nostoc sp. LPT TaxID=2815387 RepID=UPI001DC44BFE|nr:hypothetical protein [Nostoc sp. LPT]MBN4005761.1 hypothetical protein [Nostoc sp. LPT]
MIVVDQGRYNWPRLGNTGKVKLELVGGNGEVQSNSHIKIRTTESATGNNNILGLFRIAMIVTIGKMAMMRINRAGGLLKLLAMQVQFAMAIAFASPTSPTVIKA